VGWLISGLHYPTSSRLAAERKALEFRETFLKTLSDDPGIDVCGQAARTRVSERFPKDNRRPEKKVRRGG
jgi:hypothetical protein